MKAPRSLVRLGRLLSVLEPAECHGCVHRRATRTRGCYGDVCELELHDRLLRLAFCEERNPRGLCPDFERRGAPVGPPAFGGDAA